jgi:Zn-dependent protease
MLGWSMNLFRIRGIQLSVHASFALLLAYFGWEGWSSAGWLGAAWTLAYIIALFVCVTLHELGHAVAAGRFGVRVPRILLLPIGGMAEMDTIPRRPREEIIIALAGPAVNYLIIGMLMIFVRFPSNWNPTYFELTTAEFFRHLVLVNLVMGVFNLLPAFPMDGGRVFRALLATRLNYLLATRIAVGIGKVVALAGAGFLVYHAHYLGAVLFAFIIFAGERELQAVIRFEQSAAHWRDFQSRMQGAEVLQPGQTEPPRII